MRSQARLAKATVPNMAPGDGAMGSLTLFSNSNVREALSDRGVEHLWKWKDSGISRRRFLQLLSVGGSAAALAACDRRPQASQQGPTETSRPWVKDPTPFIQHPTNLETRLELIRGFITPNDLFFVRNHASTPRIDPETYRLRIEGDAIARPLELTYEEILRLPSHSAVAYLECAGNWRSFYDKVLGQVARGGQWGTGAVGCASWTGASLATVLELAGIKRNAVDVNLIGLDDGEFNKPMSVEKAMDPNTILAYAMNGDLLPPDHGFPVRAVVPGWAGSNSVKWVGRVVVSSEKIWVKNNTTSYVLIGPNWPPRQYAPAQGSPITTLNIKGVLALPWPAKLNQGSQLIRGFAYSPHGKIDNVVWSLDRGTRWRRARIVEPVLENAWTRFELTWDAAPGSHTVMVRATDEQGHTQPETVAFNEKGYLLNIPLPHPVEVA